MQMYKSGSMLLHRVEVFLVAGFEKLAVKLGGDDKPVLKPQVLAESHHIGQVTTCLQDFCGHSGIMFHGGIE